MIEDWCTFSKLRMYYRYIVCMDLHSSDKTIAQLYSLYILLQLQLLPLLSFYILQST
jgi:hypothetical protein